MLPFCWQFFLQALVCVLLFAPRSFGQEAEAPAVVAAVEAEEAEEAEEVRREGPFAVARVHSSMTFSC